MKTVQISLNSIDKVKSFVNDITKFDVDFDLVSGRYVIDPLSIPPWIVLWLPEFFDHVRDSQGKPPLFPLKNNCQCL